MSGKGKDVLEELQRRWREGMLSKGEMIQGLVDAAVAGDFSEVALAAPAELTVDFLRHLHTLAESSTGDVVVTVGGTFAFDHDPDQDRADAQRREHEAWKREQQQHLAVTVLPAVRNWWRRTVRAAAEPGGAGSMEWLRKTEQVLRDHLEGAEIESPAGDLEWLILRCQDTLAMGGDHRRGSVVDLTGDIVGLDEEHPGLLPRWVIVEAAVQQAALGASLDACS